VKELKRTRCGLCPAICGLDAHTEQGKLVKVEGTTDDPISLGYICPKGEAATEIVYHPGRLKFPIRRDGQIRKRISWNEALDSIAGKLKAIEGEFGAKAVAVHTGTAVAMTGTNPLVRRFCSFYGTPNYFEINFCAAPRDLGVVYTYGVGKNMFPPGLRDSKCIIGWGTNMHESYGNKEQHSDFARSKGAKVIVIDPRLTESAEKADIHIQIRPGTDGTLALGMLNVILTEGLYNKEFVEQWTVGFDKLAELVKEYPPEKVEKITWVPAQTVREIARIYAKNSPASIYLGHGLDLHTNAVQNVRAIMLLPAVTGNVAVPGGNVLIGGSFEPYDTANLKDITLYDRLAADETLMHDRRPLYSIARKEPSTLGILEQMVTGEPYPIKALIVAGGNPMTQWPNTPRVATALESLDLLIVMDLFMTQTAQLAHIVLPAASCFERTELRMGLSLMQKAIEPLYECKTDYEFWVELARRMGYGEYFPWKTVEDFIEFELESSGIKLQDLREKGVVPLQYKGKRFNTPSGKIEIYSETFLENGYDPLPVFKEPKPSASSGEDLTEEYPLTLIGGSRILEYTHSRYRDVPSLHKRIPEPYVEIHPETAKKLGIMDSKKVLVETPKGKITIKPWITERIHPQVVYIPDGGDAAGWAEARLNFLTEDEVSDPISGDHPSHSMVCRISRIS